MRYGLSEERCRALTVVEVIRHVRARRWRDRRKALVVAWHTAALMRGTKDLPELETLLDPSLLKARQLEGEDGVVAAESHESLMARMLKE